MAAKKIQTSPDGITYTTLPGNSGSVSSEGALIDDTIFGYNFESQFVNLINWKLEANGLFKGLAGYQVGLKKSGTPTTMTAEACSLVSGKTYKITNAAHAVMDPATVPVVKGNAIVIANSNILNIDYLFGTVTFIPAYTPTTPITIDGKYLPMTVIGGAKTFNLQLSCSTIDTTTIAAAQANGGLRTYDYGLRNVGLDLTDVYAVSNGALAALLSRGVVVAEICPDNSALAVARGFFNYAKQSQSGNVGDLEMEQVTLNGYVPDIANMLAPFSWSISGSSTLNVSLQTAITCWQNGAVCYQKYMPDGVTGVSGQGVVTDISLSGGLEAMNEFTVNIQGSGALTAF